MGERVEVVVHAFHRHHGLLVMIHGQGLILHTLRGHGHLRQLSYLRQQRVIGRGGLSRNGNHLQLWVEIREERGHQVMKSVENAQYDDQSHRRHGHAYHRNDGDNVDGIGLFLGKQIASRYVKRKIHRFFLNEKDKSSPRRLLLQQLVNALYVVQTVVDEEAQLRNDTQLIAHSLAQIVAYGLLVGDDVLEYLLTFIAGENAQIGGANAEVGTYFHPGDAHHDAVHHAGLTLKNGRQLLLQQARYTILSCFLHNIIML